MARKLKRNILLLGFVLQFLKGSAHKNNNFT